VEGPALTKGTAHRSLGCCRRSDAEDHRPRRGRRHDRAQGHYQHHVRRLLHGGPETLQSVLMLLRAGRLPCDKGRPPLALCRGGRARQSGGRHRGQAGRSGAPSSPCSLCITLHLPLTSARSPGCRRGRPGYLARSHRCRQREPQNNFLVSRHVCRGLTCSLAAAETCRQPDEPGSGHRQGH
jgi:hypothetical protein